MGFANLTGAAFNCYNSTGSFSRSAVNSDVGAKSPLAGGICGASPPVGVQSGWVGGRF